MKILQFGTGVFLRGFFDWMVEEVNRNELADASVTVVKLTSRGDMTAFRNQQGYHVVIRGLQDGSPVDELQKINCLKEFINPYKQWQEFLHSAEDQEYKLIVSNSTEAGLCFASTDTLDNCPDSFPAKLYGWLKHRFDHFSGSAESGIQIMACELVPDNSTKLKELILKHAAEHESDSSFANWLETHCGFINTLVDRIVSKLPEEEIVKLQKEWNVNDNLMLCAEPYHFLAVDSDKIEDILPFKKAGLNVIVTGNLDAVRERKVKVLNGAHMLLIPAGLDLGMTIVEETLKHKELRDFAESCLRDEIAVTVSDPEIDSYIASVIERFENPFLNHRLQNIALNSTAKISQRLYPSLIDYKNESGRYPEKLLYAIAFFLEAMRGELNGEAINTKWGELRDNKDYLEVLNSAGSLTGEQTAALMTDSETWPLPENLQHSFRESLGTIIENVRSKGIEKTLKDLIK